MVVQYKCSNCGADLAFDADSGMLHCDSCGNYEEIEYKKAEAEQDKEQDEDSADDDTIIGHTDISEDEANEYQCNNCGAVLITDKDTAATTCSFCNAPMILNDRLSGKLAPAKVIPFTISKDNAITAFKSWCRGGLLTPKGFMTADRIKSITGIYVPFWLYDLDSTGEVSATCTRTRKYTRGDYIYTETSFYDVYRKVNLNYQQIPADASSKLDDTLMDKLEPFNYSNLKDFNLPYLSGYIAEKYNYDSKQLFPRIKERVSRYVDQYIASTIVGYTTTTYNYKDIDIRNKKADYALFPVWMVYYNYKDKDYIFAMNGQTGKVVGKPPLSIGKIIAWFSGISGGAFIILSIIAWILGGS